MLLFCYYLFHYFTVLFYYFTVQFKKCYYFTVLCQGWIRDVPSRVRVLDRVLQVFITRTRPSIMQYSAVTRPHVITLMFIGPNMKMCAVTHITAAFLQKVRFSSEKKYYCAMLQNLPCSGIRVRVDRCL